MNKNTQNTPLKSAPYQHFKNTQELIELLNKINPQTDFNIKLIKAYNTAKYFTSEIKIDDTFKNISFDINELNCKLKHQQETENGSQTRVKASFSILDAGEIGTVFTLLSEKLTLAIRKNFSEKLYPTIVSMLQTTVKVTNEEGLDEIIDLEKPVGWIMLKNLMKPKYDKTRFGGKVTVVQNTGKNTTSKTLSNPTYTELQKHWSRRAYVSGALSIDNIMILGKDIMITVSFSTKDLVILPISYIKDNTEHLETIQRMTTFAVKNNIVTEEEKTEEDPNENSEENTF